MGNKKFIPQTQKEEVLYYLKRYGRITTIQASNDLYIADLQGVIRDLRKVIDISDEWVYKKNKFGRPCRYKRYFLEPEDRETLFNRLRLFM